MEIQPVYDLSRSIWRLQTARAILNLFVAGNIWQPAFKAPSGKRRLIWALTAEGTTGGTLGIFLAPTSPGNVAPVIANDDVIPLVAWGTTTLFASSLHYPIPMEAGWEIGAYSNNTAGDAARTIRIIYSEEESYAK